MRQQESGFVLPLALIVLALLTVLSLGLSHMARDGVREMTIQKQSFEREIRLKNAAQWVIYQLLTGHRGMQSISDGAVRIPINGDPVQYQGVEIRVQDAAGLLGLAFYDQQMFQRLLTHLAGKNVAVALAARLADWVDSDSRLTHRGGEAADYLAAGLPMSPRNGPLRTLDELLDVPGLTPELFNGEAGKPGLRDLLMAGGEGYFNLATAPDVLIAPVLEISDARAAQIIALRKTRQWGRIRQIVKHYPLFVEDEPFRQGFRFRIYLNDIGSDKAQGARLEIKLQPVSRVPYAIMLWQYPDHERG